MMNIPCTALTVDGKPQFVEEQAIDRVHRLNQTQDVVVYKLTISDTVEERILELQEAKRKLANAAIEGGKTLNKLNMQDIMRLFRRDADLVQGGDNISAELGSGVGRLAVAPKPAKHGSMARHTGPGKQTVVRREDEVYGRR